jgi:hypothetical protein
VKRFDRRDHPLRLGLRLSNIIGFGIAIALSGLGPACAAGRASDVPARLEAHVGEGEGQIPPVVLERARAHYLRKGVRNPCYFAMDATRPNAGAAGRRFYVICEADRSFRAISAGHAGGRSDGCTSWSPLDARQIIPMLKDNPTTVYIYPESRDIDAVARTGRGRILLERLLLEGNRFTQVLA